MDLKQLETRFFEVFNSEVEQVKLFFSPGRVNLIGEHIDYNGGFVFPAAITFGTYAAVGLRTDGKVGVYSRNFADDGMILFELSNLERCKNESWSVYVKGVIDVFIKAGYDVKQGFNAYIDTTLPKGVGGLSTSASLELLIGQILDELNCLNIDMIEKVKLAQKAENEYVGVNCGIMDQFAIGMGKKDHAIKLNTNDLSYEYAACDLQDYRVLIMNTNKKRELANSKYNERREECDKALECLRIKADIIHLCDLTPETFDQIADILEEEILYKRAKHAVHENERVKLAINALEQGDLSTFGELLNKSHQSLRDDYEVTGEELDVIVALAWEQDGVLGARMTGAGFGGCAIAIVHKDKLQMVQDAIAKGYKDIIGYDASFYVASIGDGTKTL